MDKKSYIIKVLETIKGDWPMAEGLLVLVQQGNLSEEILDALAQMLDAAIKETNNELLKAKLTQAQQVIQKIKQTEAKEKEEEAQEILDLEAMIANI